MRSKRSFVSLLTALSFLVLALTGVLAFARPFSIRIVGVHALIGFVFIALIALHAFNNQAELKRYCRSKTFWTTLAMVAGWTGFLLWQPAPVRAILGWGKNLGPALERFEMSGDGLSFHYTPAAQYRMELSVKAGPAFDPENPPLIAIWLENASFYHIKTLHQPARSRAKLPYWNFKVRGWENARREAEESGTDLAERAGVDAISAPTRNSSFDPADYVLPADPENPMPYRLLIEIDQPGDGQASLVYAVDIDNADPRFFQLLELVGYPKREEDDEEGKEVWALYYIDERFDTAPKLIDSALLSIERGNPPAPSSPGSSVR